VAKRFLTNIDLSKNEIQNVVIHKLATAPSSPTEAQLYFNSTDKRYYLRVGLDWKDVTGQIDDILTSTNAITITDNGDGTLSIDVADVTGVNSGLMSSVDKTKLDGSTATDTASTLVERDASGNFAAGVITVDNIISNAPTQPNHLTTKSYVDNLVASGVNIVAALDCSGNPNYPATTSIGDAYHVSVAGKIGGTSGQLVEVGDLIVAVAISAGGTEASVGNDFIIMQTNNDYATETIAGIVRLSTTPQVTAGVDDTTAVTPAKLASYVASLITAGKYAVNVGDGVATVIAVTHALGVEDVGVTIRDTTTKELVETDISITNINTVTVTFAVAPSTNAYRVVVQG